MSRSRRSPLCLSRDVHYDFLTALEWGRVDDGQGPDRWLEVSEDFHFLLDAPGGRILGFRIDDFCEWLPSDEEERAIREAGRFDVPLLVLRGAGALRIAREAGKFFGEHNSLNRDFFDRATEAGAGGEYEQELYWWRCCLQAGDPMAHFGLGYTLCDLGRYREALPHLRHYTRIAPRGPWNWVWLGRCQSGLGRFGDARDSYRRAIALSEAGAEETDAPELLAELDAFDDCGGGPAMSGREVARRLPTND
jgi:tetratricopeptide (TPR) repeat protein